MNDFVSKALFVGAIGDASLQAIVLNSEGNRFGLRSYFEQHGSLESIFIAGGMMGLFSALYKMIDPEFRVEGLMVYGTALDLIFRYLGPKIMPSLNDYYERFNVLQTILFAITPFMIVKFIPNSLAG